MSPERNPRKVTVTDLAKGLLEPAAALRNRLAAGAAKAEAKVAGIDPKLQERFRRETERAVRTEYGDAHLADLRELGTLSAAIAEQAAFYAPVHVRALARFDADPVKNAAVGSYWLRVLELAGPRELVEIARHAAGQGSAGLALAVAVEREVSRRGGAGNGGPLDEAVALARSVPIPEAEATMADELRREALEIEAAVTTYRETSSGRLRTVEKLANGYARGPQPTAEGEDGEDAEEGGDGSPAARLAAAYQRPPAA